MKRMTLALLLATLSMPFTLADKFLVDCTLPSVINRLSNQEDPFPECGNEGKTESLGHKSQNLVKNNLCAKGPVVAIRHGTLLRLQKVAEQKKLPHAGKLPKDRSVLEGLITEGGKSVGEGTLVRLAAFLKGAHFPKGIETVNCKATKQLFKDIHLDLVKNPNDDICKSVTAEMIPHFRPEVWAQITDYHEHNRPVRITGQVFFDASHQSCSENANTSPKRASIWEIHPVYAIDICKATSLTVCSVGNQSMWIPFDEWLEQQPEEEKEEEEDQ
jgi:hypothetical protein